MNYYESIKEKLIDNEIYSRVKDYSKERNRLTIYYEVGKLLSEAGKRYGDGIIKSYSKKLTLELGKGYTYTSLSRMRQFYYLNINVATMSQQLTWSHFVELLPIKNIDKNVKKIFQDKTIGIIVSREDNKYIVEYSSDRRIISRNYMFTY